MSHSSFGKLVEETCYGPCRSPGEDRGRGTYEKRDIQSWSLQVMEEMEEERKS
jgi:hypothetical protein